MLIANTNQLNPKAPEPVKLLINKPSEKLPVLVNSVPGTTSVEQTSKLVSTKSNLGEPVSLTKASGPVSPKLQPGLNSSRGGDQTETKADSDVGKLTLEHFKQSQSLCGPAALKMLLSYFGKNYSEEQMAMLAGATRIASEGDVRGYGTEHEGLVQAVKEVGGYVFAKENSKIEDLEYFIKKEKLPVIIGWFDENDDHYSVVVNITEKNIIIADPAAESPERWIDRNIFPKIWFDFVGKDDKIVSWGWYMVATFAKRKFDIKGGYYY